MAEPISIAVGSAVLVKVAEKALDSLSAKGSTLYGKSSNSVLKKYRKQFLSSVSRISEIKNLLYRQKPVYLPDIYVSPSLSHDKFEFDDIEIFEKFFENERMIVTAPAGYGKSVLLKYLAIFHIDHWREIIPVFIELRKIDFKTFNDVPDIIDYFYGGPIKARNKDSVIDFLLSGHVSLILDGYDEIIDDDKEKAQNLIERFAFDYPKIPIIISGRNDPKFENWEHFRTYEIDAMSKESTISLIEKLDYNEELKAEFLEKAIPQLFDNKDQSFVQTPLLAVLMLLTYELYKDIPDKIHLFYAQAFNALMRGHDITKSMPQRPLHCKLPDDKFKKAFSAFCAATYFKFKFDLTLEELEEYSSAALSYIGSDADPQDFYKDLLQNVCVLQYEGLRYSFVHRSFQEYFTACYLASAPNTTVARYLDARPALFGDSMVQMLLAIDQDRLEVEWVEPALEEILAVYEGMSAKDAEKHFFLDYSNAYWFTWSKGGLAGLGPPRSKLHDKIVVLDTMYSKHSFYVPWFDDWQKAGVRFRKLLDHFKPIKFQDSPVKIGNHQEHRNITNSDDLQNNTYYIEVRPSDYEAWKKLGLTGVTNDKLKKMRELKNMVKSRNLERQKFEEFGLDQIQL